MGFEPTARLGAKGWQDSVTVEKRLHSGHCQVAVHSSRKLGGDARGPPASKLMGP